MLTRRLTFGFVVYTGNFLCVSGWHERTMLKKFDPNLNQWTNPVDSNCGLEVNAIAPFSQGILNFYHHAHIHKTRDCNIMLKMILLSCAKQNLNALQYFIGFI